MCINIVVIDQCLIMSDHEKTQKHTNTHTHTQTTHKYSDEYCIVAFCKNTTIITILPLVLLIYLFVLLIV